MTSDLKKHSNNKIKIETYTFCGFYPPFSGVVLTFLLLPVIFGILERTIPEAVSQLSPLGGKCC